MQWSASYGYDAADSRAWQRIGQQDPLNPGTLFDNTRSSLFAYDGLRRLSSSELGELDFTDPDNPEIDPGTTRRTIAWDLDSLGNWSGHTTGLYDPPGTLDETVEADQVTDLRNELVGIDPGTPSDPQDDEAIISDPLGSIVADDAHFYEYDAWGRLVQVSERGDLAFDADGAIGSGTPGQWLIHFTYDGLGRLIRTQRPRPGTGGQQPTEVITHQFYYDGVRRVQDIETLPVQASGGGPLPIGQQGQWSLLTRMGREYIHSPGYVDEFVCSVDRLGAPAFILQDANYNVIALTDAAGAILTQYTWDPYGQLIDEQRATAPFADNAIGHQGLFFDRLNGDGDDPPLVAGAEGVYYARNRSLSTRFGRWLQADPNGTGLSFAAPPDVLAGFPIASAPLFAVEADIYADGIHRLHYGASSPGIHQDPMGLFINFLGPTSLAGFQADMMEQNLTTGRSLAEAIMGFIADYTQAQEFDTLIAENLDAPDSLLSQSGSEYLNAFGGGTSGEDSLALGRRIPWNKIIGHHLATKYGKYGKEFRRLFRRGKLDIDDQKNILGVLWKYHKGRGHSQRYHEFVLGRINWHMGNLTGKAAHEALLRALDEVREIVRRDPGILKR